MSTTIDRKPDFIDERLKLWAEWKVEYEEFVKRQPKTEIAITLANGDSYSGTAWQTTPFSLMRAVNQAQADSAVIARVNGDLWDLDRPLEGDCTVQLLDFEQADGRYVFWHSSAHVLGEALELEYGGHLCYGPPVEEGFYYDMHAP